MNLSSKVCLLVTGVLLLGHPGIFAIDDDGDGVSDVFQVVYNVPSAELDLDPDGDGFTSREEADFGTDPNDWRSYPSAELAPAGPGLLECSWAGFPDVRYQLQSAGDLVGWSDEGAERVGAGLILSATVPSSPERFFLKVEARGILGTDTDGDTLDAYEEALLGTDPNLTDSDRDSLSDFDEFDGGVTDPAKADSNGDGIWDGTSLQVSNGGGLDPAADDVDGDNLSNDEERALGTDPFDPDTDGDGSNDDVDAFPLDPARTALPGGGAGDTTGPAITLISPAGAVEL